MPLGRKDNGEMRTRSSSLMGGSLLFSGWAGAACSFFSGSSDGTRIDAVSFISRLSMGVFLFNPPHSRGEESFQTVFSANHMDQNLYFDQSPSSPSRTKDPFPNANQIALLDSGHYPQ